MNRVIKELHLLVGLPGSGKTTYSKEYDKWNSYRRNPKEGNIFDFDNIYRKAGFKPDMKIDWDKINSMKLKSISLPYVIIDGLFTTNEEYEQVLGVLYAHSEWIEKDVLRRAVFSLIDMAMETDPDNREILLQYVEKLESDEPIETDDEEDTSSEADSDDASEEDDLLAMLDNM